MKGIKGNITLIYNRTDKGIVRSFKSDGFSAAEIYGLLSAEAKYNLDRTVDAIKETIKAPPLAGKVG